VCSNFDHFEGTEMVSPTENTAAKSAITSILKYMAKFLSNTNIRFNCVSTDDILDNHPESFLKKYKNSCSSKRMLDPDDIIGALLFLVSDTSKFINSQNINVDDGWTLQVTFYKSWSSN
tara:strand:- start:1136 stop:1492 length:357 start_codon:yes stop_codon:yes gene_type:complete